MIKERRSDARLVWGGLLIGLGAVLLALTTGLVPGSFDAWLGPALLGAIGLGFLAIYLGAPARWWAVIPAGTLLTLAVVAAVDPLLPGGVSGAVFLLGMAVTFAAVAVVPSPHRPRTWAWIPAAVLAALAVISVGSTKAAAVFWPLVLILGGVYLVAVWALRGRQRGG